MGYLYLLHFERPIRGDGPGRPNRHYLGYAATDVWARIEQHMTGTAGVTFTRVAYERGIPFTVAGIWQGATPKHERAMKRQKNAARWCRLCRTQVRSLVLLGSILSPLSGVTRQWLALSARVQPRTLRIDAQEVVGACDTVSHALPDRLFVRDVSDELADAIAAEAEEARKDLPSNVTPIRSYPGLLDMEGLDF